MAYVEIDPEDFVKALRLLHSPTPESSDQLKALLDSYYLKQANNDAKKAKDFSNVMSALQSLNQDVKNEADKRTRASEDDSEATDIEDNENPDFASDLGLACVVCKQIEITTNNQLFECLECNQVYHQECHKPPITKKDMNDPRLVWYCSKCSKNMKKVGGKLVGANQKPVAGGKTSSGSALNLTSSANVNSVATSSAYSANYQSISAEGKSSLSNQAFKRGPASKFSSYAPVTYGKQAGLTSLNRPPVSTAAALATNKNKMVSSSAGGTASSFASSVNAMTSLDKRFPNLKKTKLAKYNN